jgi:hypothetical protein
LKSRHSAGATPMLAGLHHEHRVADDLKLVHCDDNLPAARLGEPGRQGESGDLEQRRHSATLVVEPTRLVYRSGDQIMAASYIVNGDTFVADKAG